MKGFDELLAEKIAEAIKPYAERLEQLEKMVKPEPYTVKMKEAEKIIGYKRTKIVRLILNKQLPATKLEGGKDWLFKLQDLKNFNKANS